MKIKITTDIILPKIWKAMLLKSIFYSEIREKYKNINWKTKVKYKKPKIFIKVIVTVLKKK